ncbi:MAG: hypothetical protein PUE88_06085 [Ruminococcus sp.]|nr:hypothetical protein [Ruminococcus sp.]
MSSTFCFYDMVAGYEPQATAVKLAQLGGGVQGASCPLQRVDDEHGQKSKKDKEKCCSPS